MEDAKTWAERVEEWRASGLSAEEYCRGRGLSAGTLYRWSSRVRRGGEVARAPGEAVSMARVVRTPTRQQVASGHSDGGPAAVVVEVEGARVVVPPGVDAGTVEVVLRALRAAGGGAR
jgi:transposase